MRVGNRGHMGIYFFILFILISGILNLGYILNTNSSHRFLGKVDKHQAILFAESGIDIATAWIEEGREMEPFQVYEYQEGRIEISCTQLRENVYRIKSIGVCGDKKGRVEVSIEIEGDKKPKVLDKEVR